MAATVWAPPEGMARGPTCRRFAGYDTAMFATPSLPRRIANMAVPADDISAATWRWAHLRLPEYLLAHSVRTYCWGVTLAAGEGWRLDRQVLWTASLMHDVGLTQIRRNIRCFEVEGAEIARQFLEKLGMPAEVAKAVSRAIVLHMQPSVTVADGVEAVLLDRATSLDVRGVGYELIDAVRTPVLRAFPRRAFDRLFSKAMAREAAARPTCQSTRLLRQMGAANEVTRSRWAKGAADDRGR
jgi:cyanamide hydratase family protein with HD domain